MLPRAIISKQAGYSPREAHEPLTAISRVTTAWRGNSTFGAKLPTSVSWPPLAAPNRHLHGGRPPTTSTDRSAPRPLVLRRISARTSPLSGLNPSSAPKRTATRDDRARYRRRRSDRSPPPAGPGRPRGRSYRRRRQRPYRRGKCGCGLSRARRSTAARPGGMDEVHFGRQVVKNVPRDGHVFGKRPVAAIIVAGDA